MLLALFPRRVQTDIKSNDQGVTYTHSMILIMLLTTYSIESKYNNCKQNSSWIIQGGGWAGINIWEISC